MDFERIKKIIRVTREKVILIENNEPDLVVMPFGEYEKLIGRQDSSSLLTGSNLSSLGNRPETPQGVPEVVVDLDDLRFPRFAAPERQRSEPASPRHEPSLAETSRGGRGEWEEEEEEEERRDSRRGLSPRLEDVHLEDLPL